MSSEQPHRHGLHHHDEQDGRHHPQPLSESELMSAVDPANSHDASAHEHVKHSHGYGHADISGPQVFTVMSLTGSQRYSYQSQLNGITHTPPVPPPNA